MNLRTLGSPLEEDTKQVAGEISFSLPNITLRGAKFKVAEVTSDTITVIPLSTGKKRPIKRAKIEDGIELLRQGEDLTPSGNEI